MYGKHQKLLTHLVFAHRRLPLVASILFFAFTAGCLSAEPPAETLSPTPARDCFPDSVFTAEEMRARVECHPASYKMEISNDTVVLFAFPDPAMDWVGPIFVIHIPSVSETVLGTDGNVLFEDYKTSDGREAIEDVLNNEQLLARILERAKENENSDKP